MGKSKKKKNNQKSKILLPFIIVYFYDFFQKIIWYLDRKDNLEDTLEPKIFPTQKEGFKIFKDQIPFMSSNRTDQKPLSSN